MILEALKKNRIVSTPYYESGMQPIRLEDGGRLRENSVEK